MKNPTNRHKPAKSVGELRIIGGQWRGRKLSFADLNGLRPSGDRIRETLFNWLAPYLPGTTCLDLFAGSGALGFEALSRGAAQLYFVDSAAQVIQQLQQHRQTLNCSNADIIQADGLSWLKNHSTKSNGGFDIVFLDPPFADDKLAECFELLQLPGILKPSALIYFEASRDSILPALADSWTLHRHKKTGQIQYGLISVHPETGGFR